MQEQIYLQMDRFGCLHLHTPGACIFFQFEQDIEGVLELLGVTEEQRRSLEEGWPVCPTENQQAWWDELAAEYEEAGAAAPLADCVMP